MGKQVSIKQIVLHSLLHRRTKLQLMQLNKLSTQRILSIDALRGITILVMIFVNELAGMRDIPQWMEHMPADADAMSFVDVVFPGFLFIVGMSIPFAINNRIAKGDSFIELQKHILFRTLGLLVLGFFMVNAEEGIDAAATGMSLNVWSLLFFAAVIMIWKVYKTNNRTLVYILKIAGFILLFVLAYIFRNEKSEPVSPHWWGILGLIGWAYLYSCVIYQLCKGNVAVLIFFIAFCTAWYAAGHASFVKDNTSLRWIASQSGNAAHTSVVLCGMVVSLLFFDEKKATAISGRYVQVFIFIAVLFIAGYFLRPFFQISKIHATPTWCLWSAGFCSMIFCFLYWLIDIKKIQGWTNFFKPAASNPLLTYIIPDIIYYLTALLSVSLWPDSLSYGIPGMCFSLFFAVAVMGVVILLNKIHLKLQL